jgi:hypothetical protein
MGYRSLSIISTDVGHTKKTAAVATLSDLHSEGTGFESVPGYSKLELSNFTHFLQVKERQYLDELLNILTCSPLLTI